MYSNQGTYHPDSSYSDIQSADHSAMTAARHAQGSNPHSDSLRRGRSPSNPLMGPAFSKGGPPSSWHDSASNQTAPTPSKAFAITTAAALTGVKLKRAFAARKKNKSVDTFTHLNSVETEGRPRNNSVAGTSSSYHDAQPRDAQPVSLSSSAPKNTKMMLQVASHNNNGGRSIPPALESPLPPPPPPKPANMQLKPVPPPIVPPSPISDNRSSIITVSPGISSAVYFMQEEEYRRRAAQAIQEEKEDPPVEASKDVWRNSDATITHIRPGATSGSRPSRPVSAADSLQSTHTIVPNGKRRSVVLTDADLVEEDAVSLEDLSATNTSSLPSRNKNRRSLSLNMAPVPVTRSEGISDYVDLQVARSLNSHSPDSSISSSSVRETPTLTRAAANGIITPTSETFLSTTNNIRGKLAAWTATATSRVPKAVSPTNGKSTGGASQATGLAKRAVEKFGRWGGFSSNSSTSITSGYSSSSSSTGPSSYSDHGLSRVHSNQSKDRIRRTPDAPSGAWSVNSSVSSSFSDSEPVMTPTGPDLGVLVRPPLVKIKPGGTGLVFGKELHHVVRTTAIWVGKPDQMHKRDGHHRNGSISQENLSPLESRMLPAIVVRCAQHILLWGTQEEGLFRVSGRPAHVSKVRGEFDAGADYDMRECSPGEVDPHAVASVFKAFLRELPDPIIPRSLIPYFDVALSEESKSLPQNAAGPMKIGGRGPGLPSGPKAGGGPMLRKPPSLSTLAMPSFTGTPPPSRALRNALRSLIQQLPEENRDILRTVTELIKATAKESRQTKMPLSNLLLVFCPSLNMNPPLLKVLCEADDIWEAGPLESPVIDIKRESVGVLDISSPPPCAKDEKGSDSGIEIEDEKEIAVKEIKEEEQRREVSEPELSVPDFVAQANEVKPKDSGSVARIPDPVTPSDHSRESSSSHPLPPPPPVKVVEQQETVAAREESQGVSRNSSKKRIILRNRPMGPRQKTSPAVFTQDNDSEISSLLSYLGADPGNPDGFDASQQDTSSAVSSSTESLSTNESSSGPNTSMSEISIDQKPEVEKVPITTSPQISISSTPRRSRGSVQFPRTSDSAPTSPLSTRRSFPILSLPSLKGDGSPPSSSVPTSPSPSAFKRILKPSLLFSKRSTSSLNNSTGLGKLSISAPMLSLPSASFSDPVSDPSPFTASLFSPPQASGYVLDTAVDSSSLSASFGLNIEIASPGTEEIGYQDFPMTPYPPGSTPIADRYQSAASSTSSLVSPSTEPVSHLRPVPTRRIAEGPSAASASRLALLDTEDTSEWTKSVLMDFNISRFDKTSS